MHDQQINTHMPHTHQPAHNTPDHIPEWLRTAFENHRLTVIHSADNEYRSQNFKRYNNTAEFSVVMGPKDPVVYEIYVHWWIQHRGRVYDLIDTAVVVKFTQQITRTAGRDPPNIWMYQGQTLEKHVYGILQTLLGCNISNLQHALHGFNLKQSHAAHWQLSGASLTACIQNQLGDVFGALYGMVVDDYLHQVRVNTR